MLLYIFCYVNSFASDLYSILWILDPTLQPGYSLRNFVGHSTTVMSLDFHPTKEDLICSCDSNSEIRYWSIKNGTSAGVFKVQNPMLFISRRNFTQSLFFPFFAFLSFFLFFHKTILSYFVRVVQPS